MSGVSFFSIKDTSPMQLGSHYMTSFNLNSLLPGLVYKCSHFGGKGFNIPILEYTIQSIACSVLEEGGLEYLRFWE